MFKRHIHPDDVPLFSKDIAICQRVFDIVRAETSIEPGTPQSDLIASHIIHGYKQGIRDVSQLLILARTVAMT